MAKNIVIFSDGTAQEGGKGANTNIYKMFNMIEDRTPNQVSFYDAGVGTGWRRLTGNIGGAGISRNIRQAYAFLHENFEADDSIYLFGFSRGAATVRSLSAMIHHFGVLPKSRPELIRKAYRIYRMRDPEDVERQAAGLVNRNHTMWTRIRFIGVYDTVAALGLSLHLPSRLVDRIPGLQHRFHDFSLSESVDHARQALSIDEERRTFHPVLWDPLDPDSNQTLRQVWFAGVHTDVGGGYPEAGLGDIALTWLMKEAVAKGLRIYPHHEYEPAPNPHGLMHNSRGKPWLKLYRRQVRSWPATRPDKPILHGSVIERIAQPDPPGDKPYQRWILGLDHEVEPSDRAEHGDLIPVSKP
ncbi:MAG: DUF2235 domain-containing protein [Acidobacteria bacterium]|nr:MAG: DUF2235 domain-containing protein [Acidobacteriota bacterium]